MQYKCLFCDNYARPTSYKTCENSACFTKLKTFYEQSKRYGDITTARKMEVKLRKEVMALYGKKNKLRSLRDYIRIEKRLGERRYN